MLAPPDDLDNMRCRIGQAWRRCGERDDIAAARAGAAGLGDRAQAPTRRSPVRAGMGPAPCRRRGSAGREWADVGGAVGAGRGAGKATCVAPVVMTICRMTTCLHCRARGKL